ncbi:MAG: hypothetical protein EAZ12_02570 [Sphingobacteriia bacterium]|nr:MAG: hypothetical protein EAZ12_02570 [Sphingobacteriia bacterium]
MSTYYFIRSEENVSIWKKYSWSFIWAALAIFKIIDFVNSRKYWDLFVGLIFVLNVAMPFFYRKKKIKPYIKIDAAGVEWLLDDFNHPITLTWNEIKRVKFEKEGVSLYQESSFCDFISLNGLEQSKMGDLQDEFRKYAVVT